MKSYVNEHVNIELYERKSIIKKNNMISDLIYVS